MNDESNQNWVGANYKRKEDKRLTSGRGQYFSDIKVPGALHLVFVRSPMAHAKIKSIDTSAAKTMKGVVAVVTAADITDEIKSLAQPSLIPALPANYPNHWPLAVDKVKFHGEAVAAVIATDRYIAADAAEAVEVDYDELPVVTDMEAALEEGSPIVLDEFGTNEQLAMNLTGGMTEEEQQAKQKAIDDLLDGAKVRIKRRFRVHRCGVTPLEPRGAMAKWDDDGLTAWITSQRPHVDKLALADVLDLPSDKVRVIAPRDQGGAFGSKAPVYREPILVAHMARKLRRPVRWLETREECLMTIAQERDQIHDIEIGADETGRIVALRDHMIADNGEGAQGGYWGFIMPFYGALVVSGAYDIPNQDIQFRIANTNKATLSPARSFGAFAARFAMDRAMDLVAGELGIDPITIRKRNLISEYPYTSGCGIFHDSGDYNAVLDSVAEKMDLPAFRAEQESARAEGRYIGIGFSTGSELSGVSSHVFVGMNNPPGYGAVAMRIDPNGKVQMSQGDAPQGQGHETAMAQVCAQEFGINPDDVTLVSGDTEHTPFGVGTLGAKSGSYNVSAIVNAARVLKKKIATILAHDLEMEGADPDDFIFAGGKVTHRDDPEKSSGFAELTHRIVMAPLNLPEGMQAGLEHTDYFEADVPMLVFGAHACIVEVDATTGEFKILRYVTADDVGTVINPQVVEGQVHGGVIQGISNTCLEEFVYNENGQQMSSTFESYKMMNAADAINVESYHDVHTLCPHTPLGSRGLGEGVPGPVPAALTNAVCDALSPFGIEINQLPLRPNRIWKAIQDAKGA